MTATLSSVSAESTAPAEDDVPPATPDLPLDERAPELEAFLATLEGAPGNGLTACPGRTVHELAAHVAGNYVEISRHIEAYLEGDPITRTRTFDEREAEYRVMEASELITVVDEGEARMRTALGTLLTQEEDPVLRWTNRSVHAKGFLKHTRSECAVHRWDVAGDDQTSDELLSPYELLEHVVNFLGATPITARGLATGAGTGRSLTARIRSEPDPDLLVRVHRGEPEFRLVPIEGEALVEADPSARLLMLWGRRPAPFTRLRATGPVEEVSRLQWLLSGY